MRSARRVGLGTATAADGHITFVPNAIAAWPQWQRRGRQNSLPRSRAAHAAPRCDPPSSAHVQHGCCVRTNRHQPCIRQTHPRLRSRDSRAYLMGCAPLWPNAHHGHRHCEPSLTLARPSNLSAPGQSVTQGSYGPAGIARLQGRASCSAGQQPWAARQLPRRSPHAPLRPPATSHYHSCTRRPRLRILGAAPSSCPRLHGSRNAAGHTRTAAAAAELRPSRMSRRVAAPALASTTAPRRPAHRSRCAAELRGSELRRG
jgi:hypothetical protein